MILANAHAREIGTRFSIGLRAGRILGLWHAGVRFFYGAQSGLTRITLGPQFEIAHP